MDIITNEELARLYNLACMATYSPWDLADFDRESIDMAHKLHAVIHAKRTALIAWQLQASGAALENQRLKAILQGILDNDGGETGFNAFELDKFRQQAHAAIGER